MLFRERLRDPDYDRRPCSGTVREQFAEMIMISSPELVFDYDNSFILIGE